MTTFHINLFYPQLSEETCATWLKGTRMLQITDLAARILVPSTAVLVWLKRRMYLTFATPCKEVVTMMYVSRGKTNMRCSRVSQRGVTEEIVRRRKSVP
jgi:hypothetical protein